LSAELRSAFDVVRAGKPAQRAACFGLRKISL
jgi:hypothetical protein